MPTFRVTDPNTGQSLSLTGDSAPNEQELNQIFSQFQATQPTIQPTAQPQQQAIGVQQDGIIRDSVDGGGGPLGGVQPVAPPQELPQAAQFLPEQAAGAAAPSFQRIPERIPTRAEQPSFPGAGIIEPALAIASGIPAEIGSGLAG